VLTTKTWTVYHTHQGHHGNPPRFSQQDVEAATFDEAVDEATAINDGDCTIDGNRDKRVIWIYWH